MLIRRIAALTLSIALFHLSVSRADAACASHEGEVVRTATGMTADDHAHHGSTESAPSSEEGCDAPATRDCCATTASCAVSFDANASTTEAESNVTVAPPGAPAPLALSSVDAAPETPPPRA